MAECMFPYFVERQIYHNQQDAKVPVPCGKCPDCLKRRSSNWGFRLKKEEERSGSALFVTLTYDTHHVPISPHGFMTLDHRDIQKFFKRLRNENQSPRPIRYYIAGEYGTQNRRPHYHCILFNSSEFDVLKAWVSPHTNKPIGQVHFGDVSGASIGYTVKYLNKGSWKPDHAKDDRKPEYSTMSKGLGENYLTPSIVEYHRTNLDRAYVTDTGGAKFAIPRYYKQKIFKTELSQTPKNEELIKQHPSILIHLEENKKLLNEQNAIVKKMNDEKPKLDMTDKELHESRKNAIDVFKNFHKNKRS